MVRDPHGVLWLERCASTNDEAARRLSEPGLRAVAAHTQTAGRGRRGRSWSSPPGHGLYLSWIARPRFSQRLGGAVPLLAAAAVAEQCEALGVRPTLKWPNDLLLGDRKLAGILCEAQGQPEAWTAVVGLGLNLRTPRGGYPPGVPGVALDVAHSPAEVAAALLPRLDRWLDTVAEHGLAPVLAAWQNYAPPAGTRLRQAQVEGVYAGLAEDGALRLRDDAGRLHTIHAGQVDLVGQLGSG
jgi:BirA family transcriptional regulator, biotin operon repressor / biotin---[acetyl-CoA-carboxylase] ligase